MPARRAAHQHQQHAQQLGRLPLPELVYGIEARRAQRSGLEKTGQPFFARGQRAHRRGVIIFQQRNQNATAQQQHGRGHQHKPRMQVQPSFAQPQQDGKSHASQRNQGDDDQVDQPVPRIARQRTVGAHQVKARVAKRRHAVKHRAPYALAPAELRDKADGQQRGPDSFYHERYRRGRARQAQHALQPFLPEALGQHHPLAQRYAPPRQREQRGRHGHKPEAAQLNHRQDNGLAKAGEVCARVHNDQARHACGRHGGEQRVKKAHAARSYGRSGQAQQRCAQQNNGQKPCGQNADGPDSLS